MWRALIVVVALAMVGCAEKKPAVPTIPAPPDLVHIKGSCIIGALADAKACDVVKVKGIGPALDCHEILIKIAEIGCLPAPNPAAKK